TVAVSSPLEPASVLPRWKHGEEERERGEGEKRGAQAIAADASCEHLPPPLLFAFSGSRNRIMERNPPACPRPSVVDTILGRPDSCWDLDSTLPLGAYQIGVVQVLPHRCFGISETIRIGDCYRVQGKILIFLEAMLL
ncbi:hypothetical protein B296_00024816, partial [Ensete ventricosum]